MFPISRIVAIVATVAGLAAVPAVASAGTVPMRGVVSGSPYGASNGQMAVPVLFSKMTARNAGLKSPVGVIILKRTQKVKLPNGSGFTLPVNMRTGDRFKGLGVIGAPQQRAFYPRVVFPKAVVYFRSKELSLSEISAAIASLQQALADLQAQFNAFKNASIKAFQDLYAQLADLQKQLAALQALHLPDFQAQIDALSKKLNDLIAGLPDFSKFALVSQLPDLTQYVKLSDLAGLIGANSTITTLQSQVATLQTQVTSLTNRLTSLCTALNVSAITSLAPGVATACS